MTDFFLIIIPLKNKNKNKNSVFVHIARFQSFHLDLCFAAGLTAENKQKQVNKKTVMASSQFNSNLYSDMMVYI